jgi:hypothetical protein
MSKRLRLDAWVLLSGATGRGTEGNLPILSTSRTLSAAICELGFPVAYI